MRLLSRHVRYLVIGIMWAGAVSAGGWRLWGYDSTAGASAQPPIIWPAATHLPRNPALPTLVVLVHPQCPCSGATIGELARLMADCNEKVLANVMMLRPAGVPSGWEQTDLWRSAAAIPGVTVISDEHGEEARRFGAMTSGQVLLFASNGRLLFAGGITESRGHSGDNAGRSAIEALILNSDAASPVTVIGTPVYGCPLFGDPAAERKAR